jgi:hypothetical protein
MRFYFGQKKSSSTLRKDGSMSKVGLYDFYIENCVDETKGEIPLSFKEWEREIYPDDVIFIERIVI